jgi:hypothetical protein
VAGRRAGRLSILARIFWLNARLFFLPATATALAAFETAAFICRHRGGWQAEARRRGLLADDDGGEPQ